MQTMKKMFYVLLALLVSMVLVFGVSCDNSNKAPGGVDNPSVEEPGTGEEPGSEDPVPEEPEYPIDLGTEFAIPDWLDGTYKGDMGSLIVDAGTFTMAVANGAITVSEKGINPIEKQEIRLDENNNLQYYLEATFATEQGIPLGPNTLTVTQKDENSIDVTFSMLQDTVISFTKDI